MDFTKKKKENEFEMKSCLIFKFEQDTKNTRIEIRAATDDVEVWIFTQDLLCI